MNGYETGIKTDVMFLLGDAIGNTESTSLTGSDGSLLGKQGDKKKHRTNCTQQMFHLLHRVLLTYKQFVDVCRRDEAEFNEGT